MYRDDLHGKYNDIRLYEALKIKHRRGYSFLLKEYFKKREETSTNNRVVIK